MMAVRARRATGGGDVTFISLEFNLARSFAD